MATKQNPEIPSEIRPKRTEEIIRVAIPPESTPARSVLAAEVVADPALDGMLCIDEPILRKIQGLGIQVESLGLGVMAQGHLFASASFILSIEKKLAAKAEAPDIGISDLKTIAYALGYLGDKKSRLATAVKSVAQATGKMAGGDGDDKKPPTRQSFPPQAVIHAAPGSTIQVGIQQPKAS